MIVLNPDPEGMDLILQYHLEPEIYNELISLNSFQQCQFRQETAVIHIKLDSGTHRLGFGPRRISRINWVWAGQPWIKWGPFSPICPARMEEKLDDFSMKR